MFEFCRRLRVFDYDNVIVLALEARRIVIQNAPAARSGPRRALAADRRPRARGAVRRIVPWSVFAPLVSRKTQDVERACLTLPRQTQQRPVE